MSDNSTPIAGGDTYATDDIGGVKYQRVKVTFGVDGAAADVSSSTPLPATVASIGDPTDTSASTDSGTFGLIALTKRLLSKFPVLGSAVSAASQPVVIASDQAAVSVTQAVAVASGTITTQNLVPAGAATANSAVEITLLGNTSLAIQTTGTYTGALSLQLTVDGTNWVTVGGVPLINLNTGGYLVNITSALQSVFQADVGGFIKARITALAAVTGTATVTLRASSNPSMLALDASLPAGTASIGTVVLGAGAASVGTVVLGAGAAAIGSVTATPATPTAFILSSAATTNLTAIKASAGTLYQLTATNNGAAVAFVKIYNLAVAPTLASSVPTHVISVPANGVPVTIPFGALGLRMGTGIALAITNLIADTDATAVVAAQIKLSISYV